MSVPGAYAVVAILLAAALAFSGRALLAGDERIVAALRRIGVPLTWSTWLAAAEIAGALGLLAGVVVEPLGVAAAAGVTLYLTGAVLGHLRAGDLKGLAAPIPLLALAVAALLLRLA